MVYLNPDVPRWTPRDETALAEAAADGLLVESHFLDLKRELARGAGSNKELARDLASFAVDGGVLIIGIDEPVDGPPILAPVSLPGLPERVEQVARSLPDPPLPIVCTPILSADDPGQGYLIVEVPATGTAPHMVEGSYYGRGDKTKLRLSDAEVLRLHRLRAQGQDEAARLLDEYIARDPVAVEASDQAHGFVVAFPVRPRPEMLLRTRPEGRWQPLLYDLRDNGAYADTISISDDYAPNLNDLHEFSRRSDGAALAYNLTAHREPAGRDDGRGPSRMVFELEVTEDGGLRVMTSRLSDHVADRGQVVLEDVLPDLTRRVVSMAAWVSARTGYLGPWAVGVAATNIAGKAAYGDGRLAHSTLGVFGTDQTDYRRTLEASVVELQQTPGGLTERLIGRFVRSIGFENAPRIRALFEDPIDKEGT